MNGILVIFMKRPSLQTCRLKRGTEMYQSLDCKKKNEPNEKSQNNPHVKCNDNKKKIRILKIPDRNHFIFQQSVAEIQM